MTDQTRRTATDASDEQETAASRHAITLAPYSGCTQATQ